MLGFLNINKPQNITSHDVIAKLRKNLGIKRIGHSGTLDPFAVGVLVIGVNESTRLFEYIPSDKEYIAEVKFGLDTDTNDITGKILNTCDKKIKLEDLKLGLKLFEGKIFQKPPIYSAIKLQGERAYDLARKGEITLENIQEKEIEVYSLEILSFSDNLLKLKIKCSSGTYIRSIARDLGEKLGTFAILQSLQRISVGDYFKLENSLELGSVNKENIRDILISPEEILTIPKVILNSAEVKDIFHGKSVKLKDKIEEGEVSLLNEDKKLIAVGIVDKDLIKPKKVFIKHD